MAKHIRGKAETVQEDQIVSLLEKAYEDFTVINGIPTSDGRGGVYTTWVDGVTFQGAMPYDSSVQMKIAQAMGVTALYTLTVNKNVELNYHAVFRRKKDNKTFRTTSNSDDKKTPEEATLNMRQYEVEEWTIPNG